MNLLQELRTSMHIALALYTRIFKITDIATVIDEPLVQVPMPVVDKVRRLDKNNNILNDFY